MAPLYYGKNRRNTFAVIFEPLSSTGSDLTWQIELH